MLSRMAVRWLAWIGALTLASGCSFVFSRGPRAGDPVDRPPSCNTSRVPVAIDTIIAGGAAVLATLMLTDDCEPDALGICHAVTRTIGAQTAAIAAIAGGSALYGSSRVGRCREARTAHHGYLAERGVRPGAPPWVRPDDPLGARDEPDDPVHSSLCRRWRARLFAAPVGVARLAVVREMPQQCH